MLYKSAAWRQSAIIDCLSHFIVVPLLKRLQFLLGAGEDLFVEKVRLSTSTLLLFAGTVVDHISQVLVPQRLALICSIAMALTSQLW